MLPLSQPEIRSDCSVSSLPPAATACHHPQLKTRPVFAVSLGGSWKLLNSNGIWNPCLADSSIY